jgi:hypothetical protein
LSLEEISFLVSKHIRRGKEKLRPYGAFLPHITVFIGHTLMPMHIENVLTSPLLILVLCHFYRHLPECHRTISRSQEVQWEKALRPPSLESWPAPGHPLCSSFGKGPGKRSLASLLLSRRPYSKCKPSALPLSP